MGLLLALECRRCDYAATITEGYGFSGLVYEAMSCRDCRELVAVPIDAKGPAELDESARGRCPRCGGTHLVSLRVAHGGGLGGERCPWCDGPLSVQRGGIWD
jgi:ssDNA-binding Zn-finger/Zn-ribbon topoisomerase 1